MKLAAILVIGIWAISLIASLECMSQANYLKLITWGIVLAAWVAGVVWVVVG